MQIERIVSALKTDIAAQSNAWKIVQLDVRKVMLMELFGTYEEASHTVQVHPSDVPKYVKLFRDELDRSMKFAVQHDMIAGQTLTDTIRVASQQENQ